MSKPYSICFDLPGLPKTPNGSHGHWRTAAAQRKKWKRMACDEIMLLGRPLNPLAKVWVTFTRFSTRAPDYDNLVSSFKGIRDALTATGIIPDDSSKFIATEYLWEPAKRGKGFVRVNIREVEAVSAQTNKNAPLVDANPDRGSLGGLT